MNGFMQNESPVGARAFALRREGKQNLCHGNCSLLQWLKVPLIIGAESLGCSFVLSLEEGQLMRQRKVLGPMIYITLSVAYSKVV